MSRRQGLLLACNVGNYEFLESFVLRNRQPSAYEVFDNHRYGPLHHAVISQSERCVELLLSSTFINRRLRTHEGHTCLFVAIISHSSDEIIQLLLQHDPELFNIPNNENVYPIHKAILMGSCRMVAAMITKLKAMRFQIEHHVDLENENELFLTARTRQVDILKFLTENLEFDYNQINDFRYNALKCAMIPVQEQLVNVDQSDEAALRVIQILLPLTYDQQATNFLETHVTALLAISCSFMNAAVYNWLIEEFYLIRSNHHRRLLRRMLRAFERMDVHLELIFSIRMLTIALHSKVQRYKLMSYHNSEILYQNLIPACRILFDYDEILFFDMFHIFRPKMVRLLFPHFLSIPDVIYIAREALIPAMQIFDAIDLPSLTDIDLCFECTSPIFYCNALELLMPFSPSVTAPLFGRNPAMEYEEVMPEDDVIMARYDVSLTTPKQFSLKSLSRLAIRKHILGDNRLRHAEKMRIFRTLDLPKSLFDYVTYNYTKYELR